jgi:hypothetical protein
MNRWTVLAAVALVLAAAMTTTALAASTAKDPKTMVLQKADLPAGARLLKKIPEKDAQISAYSVEWRFKAGAKQFDLISVASVMSRGLAVAAFREARSLFQQGYRKITLPKYGDEQVAALAREDNAGELWVRKGGVVWSISVNTADLKSGSITKAQSTAYLKQFATKQMKRVGSG